MDFKNKCYIICGISLVAILMLWVWDKNNYEKFTVNNQQGPIEQEFPFLPPKRWHNNGKDNFVWYPWNYHEAEYKTPSFIKGQWNPRWDSDHNSGQQYHTIVPKITRHHSAYMLPKDRIYKKTYDLMPNQQCGPTPNNIPVTEETPVSVPLPEEAPVSVPVTEEILVPVTVPEETLVSENEINQNIENFEFNNNYVNNKMILILIIVAFALWYFLFKKNKFY